MSINLKMPDIRELRPRITVFGVGGAGGNAVNNMIESGLQGVDFVVANTDAQALSLSKCDRIIQMGLQVTEGLGAGSRPEVGCAAAEEVLDEIRDHLSGAHMAFITAGMGGGTGTGSAPVVARAAREMGILTVGVVTKPFHFEGQRRMRVADAGIEELHKTVDTLLVIPNQNLFRVANERTTFADAFAMADQVLYSGVACITDLMVKEGLINLDFADVRAIMREMGKAMMGTGEATGEKRAIQAAEAAIANPLLDDVSMRGARGLLISITGGNDLTLYEVDEAATRIREEVDPEANIILGATFDEKLEGTIRVSVVATGIDQVAGFQPVYTEQRLAELAEKLKPQPKGEQAARTAAPRPVQVPAAQAPRPDAYAQEFLEEQLAPVPAPTAVVADDVTIRPVAPRPAPAFYDEPAPAAPEAHEESPLPFIPPAPERTRGGPRMPRIEDLPVHAQQQFAQRAPVEDHSPDRKRASLLQRLAAVGLGRREDDEPAPAAHREPPMAPPAPPRPAPQAPRQHRPADVHPQMRQPAPAPRGLEDELEIPAFLRRQAN
ncbi:cell division protein FtsZ [Terrihabitans sp. B22-R8]|uniref:cell division protein FtsZ n=1 Tax=Terrihabitans sp. B22-R8 TaxID=3425128 RepID=UPI00403C3972